MSRGKGLVPRSVVTSPGIVQATIVIDGASVSDVVMRVVLDDTQAVEAIIGRSFTDHPTVNYHKVEDTLTFEQDTTLLTTLGNVPSRSSAADEVRLPAHSINFVNLVNGQYHYAVPMMILGVYNPKIHKREPTLRGEVARRPICKPSADGKDVITCDQLDNRQRAAPQHHRRFM